MGADHGRPPIVNHDLVPRIALGVWLILGAAFGLTLAFRDGGGSLTGAVAAFVAGFVVASIVLALLWAVILAWAIVLERRP